jgi:hypothetical protein
VAVTDHAVITDDASGSAVAVTPGARDSTSVDGAACALASPGRRPSANTTAREDA